MPNKIAKILVVDDNRQVLEQVNHILAEEGFEISFIPKGEFLFQRLDRQEFDLVLLDVNLPGISGYDLLQEIRKHPKYHNLPVIIITGEDEDTTLTKCFALGAQDYIRKPINHLVLKVRVSSVISASRFHLNQIKNEREEALQARMKMLSSQMNPHFIFNALSSIQEFILSNETDKAIDYVSEFAGLMRQNLENSLVPYITLADELQFLETYLSLERTRFNNSFEFEIVLEIDEFQDIMVPPMIIQPYLENAIIHGLRKVDRIGKLTLLVKEQNNRIQCIITDNGIGRKQAELDNPRKHRSIAMSNIEARLELLNLDAKMKEFKVVIEDIVENDSPAGTIVSLCFPNDLH
ncbi:MULTISPECIES: response regulator [Flagellimonas]|uniref:Response regulator n=1 Tax=Flagellimonas spongiicola TaxID=2942208 RepID=A0ABT0PQQ5_9FLAO|nr:MULTISPECIES: response regulator [Allomuricauda]MCL6267760.1 response regulator [Muricauda myxillae]MCL6273694.1 response regulator [Allomuricauda spongiicola]